MRFDEVGMSLRLDGYRESRQQSLVKFFQLYHLYNEQMARNAVDALTKIVVYGLLNSGKSTLLNVLTGHFEQEYFATGDYRVTTANKIFEKDQVIYIDTPGIDGAVADDETAASGKSYANIILFVHGAGKELEREEIELLTELKEHFGDNFSRSVLLVLSRKDSLEDKDLDVLKDKIRQQCMELLSSELKILPVSAVIFLRAQQPEDLIKQEKLAVYSFCSTFAAKMAELCS